MNEPTPEQVARAVTSIDGADRAVTRARNAAMRLRSADSLDRIEHLKLSREVTKQITDAAVQLGHALESLDVH